MNPHTAPLSRDASVQHVLWDGNRISTWQGNHGDIVSYHVTSTSGLEWPRGSGKTAVFHTGLWLAAGIINGFPDIRTAAMEYTGEFVPGNYGSDPGDSTFRIYTIRTGDGPTTPDWINWPVAQGAPWVDVDANGSYDPIIDHPEVIGDLFQWYVMNDSDPSAHNLLWHTPPLGVEVRVMHFGFDRPGVLENTLFVRFQVINAGSNQLDSMFVSIYSDPDLGSGLDDRAGSDASLKLGFCYNDHVRFDGNDAHYGTTPPAVGHTYLQLPIVPSPGDTAWVLGDPVPDHRNLDMTSFLGFT